MKAMRATKIVTKQSITDSNVKVRTEFADALCARHRAYANTMLDKTRGALGVIMYSGSTNKEAIQYVINAIIADKRKVFNTSLDKKISDNNPIFKKRILQSIDTHLVLLGHYYVRLTTMNSELIRINTETCDPIFRGMNKRYELYEVELDNKVTKLTPMKLIDLCLIHIGLRDEEDYELLDIESKYELVRSELISGELVKLVKLVGPVK